MSAPLPEKLPIDDELEDDVVEEKPKVVEEKPKKVAVAPVKRVPVKKGAGMTITQDVEPEGAVAPKPRKVAKKVPPRRAPQRSTTTTNYIEHDV